MNKDTQHDDELQGLSRSRVNGFDLTVIAGGIVNLIVVLALLGFWLVS
ncbi:MAG: hypothetical protein RQ982_05235 [Gammaproteobacteria bacterium]|nr:hypothetical protein [Gammaproteobacteria bacterium]